MLKHYLCRNSILDDCEWLQKACCNLKKHILSCSPAHSPDKNSITENFPPIWVIDKGSRMM